LFRKGVKSLEAVEPHVRLAAEQQHIDHQFSALEEEDYSVEDENDDDYTDSHDGELSFDYGENKEATEAGHASRSPTEVVICCDISVCLKILINYIFLVLPRIF
jgi:hypothetical protein